MTRVPLRPTEVVNPFPPKVALTPDFEKLSLTPFAILTDFRKRNPMLHSLLEHAARQASLPRRPQNAGR